MRRYEADNVSKLPLPSNYTQGDLLIFLARYLWFVRSNGFSRCGASRMHAAMLESNGERSQQALPCACAT